MKAGKRVGVDRSDRRRKADSDEFLTTKAPRARSFYREWTRMHAKGRHEVSAEGQFFMIYRQAIYHELRTCRGEREFVVELDGSN